VKVGLEIEAECFIYNVHCHLTVPPHTELTAASPFLLFSTGEGLWEGYVYLTPKASYVLAALFLPEFL